MNYPSIHSLHSSDDDNEDNIEMEMLQEKPVTQIEAQYSPEDDSDNEESTSSRALLGHSTTVITRKSLYDQIKNLVIEAGPTLIFTIIGIVFTGRLMDKAPHWKAMRRIDELIMIIPVILNLKGNLEMNLSARLGTAANMGELDKPDSRRSIILGNLVLLQVQAIVVSFIATCFSFLFGLALPKQPPSVPSPSNILLGRLTVFTRKPLRPQPIPSGDHVLSGWAEFAMVSASSITAACISSTLLGSFMCGLVLLCRKFGRDPDNIAPPIASCLGDLITLLLLGLASLVFIDFVDHPVVLALISLFLFAAGIGWVFVTMANPHVKPLLTQGWSPLIGAMIISSGTGFVLDMFVSRYQDFGLLAVAISSMPGAVGSIFISRLSTALHTSASSLPTDKWNIDSQLSPKAVVITLFCITLPIEVFFLVAMYGVKWLEVPIWFSVPFMLFFCCTMVTSLFVAQILTNFLWSKNKDPDMYAMPIHSAIMDLIGQSSLVLCFEIASAFGGKVRS